MLNVTRPKYMTELVLKNLRVISKKNSRRNFGHVSLPSEAFMNFQDQALKQLMGKVKSPITARLKVCLLFGLKGQTRADVDNLSTSILDVLQKANIIADDNQVVQLVAVKGQGCREFQTNILLEEVTE